MKFFISRFWNDLKYEAIIQSSGKNCSEKAMGIKKTKKILEFFFVSLVITGGCHKSTLEPKTIAIKKFVAIDPSLLNYRKSISHLTISRDKKNIYFSADEIELYHSTSEDIEKNITLVPLATGFSGDPGKASLATANKVIGISAGRDGAMVSVIGETTVSPDFKSPDNGCFYVREKTKTAAWASRAEDMGALPATSRSPNNILAETKILGFLVEKDSNDVPYFYGNSSDSGRYVAMTKPDLSPSAALSAVRRQLPMNFWSPEHIYFASSRDFLFAVDLYGVSVISSSEIGKSANFLSVNSNTPPSASGVVGSEAFRMKTGFNNRLIQAVLVVDDLLYIAFKSFSFSGGVAVYKIKKPGEAPEVSPPDIAWSGITVKGLIKDDLGKVWAITEDNIFMANSDGKKGVSYFDTLPLADESLDEGGYDEKTFPRSGINCAQFVNGELVIGTKEGLYISKSFEKPIDDFSRKSK